MAVACSQPAVHATNSLSANAKTKHFPAGGSKPPPYIGVYTIVS